MRKHILLYISALFLCGCSSQEQKSILCSGYLNGKQITTSLQAHGDDVYIETYEEVLDLSKMGYDSNKFNDAQKQEVISLMSSRHYDTSKFENIPGVSLSAELQDNNLIIRLQFDYEEANIDDLKELHLIEDSGFLDLGISLEKTKEGYEANGLICKQPENP